MLRDVNDFGARSFALRMILSGLLGLLCFHHATLLAQSVVLTWSPSMDPAVAGYKIYSGTVSHTYTNVVVVGNVTNTTIFGLTYGNTYYFAATTYDDAGNESEFSNEAIFSVPAVAAVIGPAAVLPLPTLAAIPNVTVNENAVMQTINLSGITLSGSPFNFITPQIMLGASKSTPTLKITTKSSNTGIIPTPAINYISPKNAGTLMFKPAANAFGTATITVTLNNGEKSNNIATQSFTITVLPNPLDYPRISQQPTNTMTVAGRTVSLRVAATGLATLKYQWQFNGMKIPSNTGATLTLRNVTSAQAGNYYVTVSNSLGTTNSVTAVLAVYPNAASLQSAINQADLAAAEETPVSDTVNVAHVLPVIATPAAVLTSLAEKNGQFTFQVSGIERTNYVVQGSSDLINWVSLQTNASPFTFTDTNTDGYSQRFYRAYELR